MPYADPNKQREYVRKWVAKRRATFFRDKVCIDCGSNENLELDHVDPSAKVASAIWSWSADRQATEIAKCVVWCRDCHWKKTLAFDRHRTEHGKTRMYQNGCRCDDCKRAKRDRDKTHRERRKLRRISSVG